VPEKIKTAPAAGQALASSVSMIKAREPALFISIYLHQERREDQAMRGAILRQVQAFMDAYKLEVPQDSKALYREVAKVDFSAGHSRHELFTLLFEAQAGLARKVGAGYQAIIYSYHDSIILQFLLTRFPDWRGTLTEGWEDLASEFRAGFGEWIVHETEFSIFGASAVYWVMTDHKTHPESYEPEIRGLLGDSVKRTETDIGPLRNSELAFFPENNFHQDLWVLLTKNDSEKEANERYSKLAGGPPAFGEVMLARHKIFFELDQHRFLRKAMEDRGRILEKKTFAFISEQRRLGPKLDELVSETAIQFEEKLTQATNRLAAYRNRLGRLRELRRTLEINRRNYTLHCLRLISAKKFAQVERARDRLLVAGQALDSLEHDQIFNADLGTITQHCQQVDTDIGYSESVADRHTEALRAASDQLRIAGERETAEMARHMAVDSAAVVASIAALVVIELAEKRHHESLENKVKEHHLSFVPFFHQLESWLLVGWVILIIYGLTQAVGARLHGNKPGFKSLVAGFGLSFAWVGTLLVYHYNQNGQINTAAKFWTGGIRCVILGLIGAGIAYWLYGRVWSWMRHKRRKAVLNERQRS
jgi:hypothetical protein